MRTTPTLTVSFSGMGVLRQVSPHNRKTKLVAFSMAYVIIVPELLS
jgi:hypothetical protein